MDVNELDSAETLFPFSYYDLSFCRPEDVDFKKENLGSMLLGEQTYNTAYKVLAVTRFQ